jgi:hypothetical protein
MQIERAQLIPNEQKVNLQMGDIFDRIINLKLNCYNKVTGIRESFVIRSDYELVWLNQTFDNLGGITIGNGKYIIRRCSMKPSIKVQTKLVTSNTGTSIDVFVTNFFMVTGDGKHLRSFNESQYVVETVEIAMGYWGQFKLPQNQVPSYNDYFKLEAKNGADKIIMKAPVVVTNDKLPPDSVLHMHGYVGEVFTDPVAITSVVSPIQAIAQPVAKSGTELEQVFFENITRRYFNDSKVVNSTNIHMLKKNVPVSDIKSLPVALVVDTEGKMTELDAKTYGVRVYLSDEVKSLKLEKKLDATGKEVEQNVYFEAGWTVGQTIARIMSFLDAELEFTFSNEGDVLIYTPKEMVENIQGIADAYDKQNLYKHTVLANKQLYDSKLPAVYNINIDAVATITCPFFTFIEPFQYVEFASRYALTSTVSYYASYAPTITRFLVISASITFATQEDINEVHITAVSARDSKL